MRRFVPLSLLTGVLAAAMFLTLMSACMIGGQAPRHATRSGQAAGATASTSTQAPGSIGRSPLHVLGTHIVDRNNRPVLLRGVNRYSLEYRCRGDGHFALGDFAAMVSVWRLNYVRIQVSPAYWFNLESVCPTYQTTLIGAIRSAEMAGLYVEITVGRTEPFPANAAEAVTGGKGYPMPADLDLDFWRQFAAHYAADPAVFFDPYSEPHLISAAIWHDGGMVTVTDCATYTCGTYHTPGMQAEVDLINAVAPGHLVVVGGMYGSASQSAVLSGYVVTGSNVVYDIHTYKDTVAPNEATWNDKFLYVANRYPVIADEFGRGSTATSGCERDVDVMREFDNLGTGYAPWVWEAANNTWSLLASWDGTPSAYGQHIHDYFVGKPVSCGQAASSSIQVSTWGASWATPTRVAPGDSVTFTTNTTMSFQAPVREDFAVVDGNGATVTHVLWDHLFLSTQAQATHVTYAVSPGLPPGSYSVNITISDTAGTAIYGVCTNALTFTVA
jgi:hypothetical protein